MLGAALLLQLLAVAVSAPPPDCAGKSDALESLICADPALVAQQTQMQHLYAQALQEQPPPQRTAQEARQAAWLRHRAPCASDPQPRACVAGELGHRIVELKIVLRQTPVFATATYLCQGSEPRALRAAYYHSEPPAVQLTYLGQDVIAFAAPSGSGARYTGEGVEIWEHQGVARLTWAGAQLTCPKEAAPPP